MQRCPECDQSVEADAMNISEGVALCPKCGTLSRLSELIESYRGVQDILNQPPKGCSVESHGDKVIAKASLRSTTGFLTMGAFALFWNGIVSIFVLVVIAGLYTNLIGPLPDWFPAPPMDGDKPEMNGEPMGLGMTLFLCFFLMPFVAVGIGVFAGALMCLVGRVDVVIDEANSYAATGIGLLKWKTRFDAQQVSNVGYGDKQWRSEGGDDTLIEITADRTVKFGSSLDPEKMEWLRAVLKELLLKKHKSAIGHLPWINRIS